MIDDEPGGLMKEAYLAEKRKLALVVRSRPFTMLAKLHLSEIPLVGAAAFRTKKGEEAILINWDQFESAFGQDFTDCVPFEIEHEAEELWLTRGKERVDSFGPDHYEAIRAAMKKADSEGKLDRYMELKRAQMKMFDAMGDTHAMKELGFYSQVAEQLKEK